MSLFKTGFQAVKDEKARQDEIREKAGSRIFNFFIRGDGEEADVVFLNESPVNYYTHNIKSFKGGKEIYEDELCIGEGCTHCENGLNPTFKGSFLVVDRREVEFTKDGKQVKASDQIRMYTQGTRVLSQLARISEKYGLTDKEITVVRVGTGTSTVYSFERGGEIQFTNKEISDKLTESIREMYDGSEESIHRIIMEQLKLTIPQGSDTSEEEEDTTDRQIVSADEKPVKKLIGKKSIETSRKTSIKSLLGKKSSESTEEGFDPVDEDDVPF